MSEHGISDPLDFIHRQEAINRRDVEITRLEAINADLLAACEAAYAWMLYLVDDMVAPDERIALEKLSAAIAKARGE